MIVTGTVVARIGAEIVGLLRARRRKVAFQRLAGDPTRIPSKLPSAAGPGFGVLAPVSGRLETGPSIGSPTSKSSEQARPALAERLAGHRFQIQFLSGATGEGPPIEEAELRAPNVFAAFRAVERNTWPPGATGFRLLDSKGRKVFWRRKPGADKSHEFHLHVFPEDEELAGAFWTTSS